MIVGVVLAGGRSTRFGSEKAVALADGVPMIARVAAVLALGCARVAVNAPGTSGAAAWARATGLDVLPDPVGAPDGPLAGVLAGLEWAAERGADALATAPCDTPWLPSDVVARLAEGGGLAVAATAEGVQPLCALWPSRFRETLCRALRAGHPSVRAFLDDHGARPAPFAEAAAFANLNVPSPLA